MERGHFNKPQRGTILIVSDIMSKTTKRTLKVENRSASARDNRTVTAQNILDTIEKMVQLVTSLREISDEIENYIRTIVIQNKEIDRLRTLLRESMNRELIHAQKGQ